MTYLQTMKEAVFLSAMGLLVGAGIVMHVWSRIERGRYDDGE